jgi:FMN phosphatase YigB (HAD superfamily)
MRGRNESDVPPMAFAHPGDGTRLDSEAKLAVMDSVASVSVLVTDLDNTLWDWFEVWRAGFSAFLEQLVAISGVDQATLEAEIRVHHQTNGTSEYSPTFLIPQLQSLQDGSSRDDLLARYQDATHAWHRGRKNTTQLYPGVLDTLLAARKAGVIVVGYTESQAFVTAQRILRTDLDGVIDYLYSPPDHEIPAGVSLDELRQYDPSAYELRLTRHFHTPPGAKKPNVEVLKSILAEVRGTPGSTVYVGDSRMKDIAMAKELGVRDVSHWPDSDVAEEQRIAAENSIRPTYVLEDRFDELQDLVTFSRKRTLSTEEVERGLTTWKQAVEVQEHFNDLEMRIRNFALTLLVAVIGAAGVVLERGNKTLAAMLIVGALVSWLAFYMMDRWWYHPLLRGAVDHAIELEKRLVDDVPGIGLTGAISDASHTKLLGKERDSTWKMLWFYRLIGAVLVVVLAAIVFTPVGEKNDTKQSPSATPTATASSK